MSNQQLQDELAIKLWEHNEWEPIGPYTDLVLSVSEVLENHLEVFDVIQFGFVAHYGHSCTHTVDDWYEEGRYNPLTYCRVCDENYEEPYR